MQRTAPRDLWRGDEDAAGDREGVRAGAGRGRWLAVAGGVLAAALRLAPPAFGHGSLEDPPSRTYTCRFLTPENDLCRQAWEANPQALYDWMEVNLGDADGRHRELIPDGQLCSAGRSKYAAFDAPSAGWPATEILPQSDGLFTFEWSSTAPHSTEYYRLYLTREGFDPTQPLRWADLELVYDSGPWAAVDPVVLRTALPPRSGRHVVYVVWQRDDSREAFYACADVIIGDGVSPIPPPSPPPPAAVAVSLAVQSDWGSGYCMNATVTTSSTARIEWSVEFAMLDAITTTWNADIVQTGETATAVGHDWNLAVSAAEPQSFGFCADRRTAPPVPATQTPTSTPAVATTPSTPPSPPPPPAVDIAMPLSTSGRHLVDAEGRVVVLRGVNWFGFETANHLAHGLWTRDYDDMLAQIASLGYNTIRLPFSLQAIESQTPVSVNAANGKNAALVGLTPLRAMDVIIDAAARHGLLVLLDNHSLADDSHTYGLWFGAAGYEEADWISHWQMLARRYGNRANVVGADLKNEPHDQAQWGFGGAYDWRLAAERAGNAILAIAPHWLIVVEGVEGPSVGQQLGGHWWGGNLEGVASSPVRLDVPNRVVYSPHEYGPGVWLQPWFNPYDPATLEDRWLKGFHYIAAQGIAPILVGEFGGREVGDDTDEGRWQNQFVDFLAAEGHSFTYWSWNPNSSDTGGILNDDWTTVHQAKQEMLNRLLAGASPPPSATRTPVASSPTAVVPTATAVAPTATRTSVPPSATRTRTATRTSPPPTSTRTRTPTRTSVPASATRTRTSTRTAVPRTPTRTPTRPPSGGLVVTQTTTSDWGSGYCRNLTVSTASPTPIDWTVTFAVEGTVRELWSAVWSQSGGVVTAEGLSWNDTVARGSPAQFGFCADR